MGKEDIIARILSDADAEAGKIVETAQQNAADRIAEAEEGAKSLKAETEEEISARAKRISEGKAAAARLDSSKLLLAEKRRVIDEIYARALNALLALGEHESLVLVERLLKENAEEGDEVVFASDYPHALKAARLPVVAEKKLKVGKSQGTGGGFFLRGKACDKDVTFRALLSFDREKSEPALAARLFK